MSLKALTDSLFHSDTISRIAIGVLATLLIALGATLWDWLRPRIKRWLRGLSTYPRYIGSSEDVDMGELLDAIRFAGTKIKGWNRLAPIVGINRGGALVGALLAKHLNHSNLAIVEFSDVNNPTLLFPGALKSLMHQGAQVVVVDDRYKTGDSAAVAIRLLREQFGKGIRIYFIALTADSAHLPATYRADSTPPQERPTGSSKIKLKEIEATMVLLVKRPLRPTEVVNLPWDETAFQSEFDPQGSSIIGSRVREA
jgi:hypothetical protein